MENVHGNIIMILYLKILTFETDMEEDQQNRVINSYLESLKMKLETFENFPKIAVKDKIDLAINGFIYIGDGNNDKVKCAICNMVFEQWEETDNVTSKHRNCSKTCLHDPKSNLRNMFKQSKGLISEMKSIVKGEQCALFAKIEEQMKSLQEWIFNNSTPESMSTASST